MQRYHGVLARRKPFSAHRKTVLTTMGVLRITGNGQLRKLLTKKLPQVAASRLLGRVVYLVDNAFALEPRGIIIHLPLIHLIHQRRRKNEIGR